MRKKNTITFNNVLFVDNVIFRSMCRHGHHPFAYTLCLEKRDQMLLQYLLRNAGNSDEI